MSIQTLPLAMIRIDDRLQSRDRTDPGSQEAFEAKVGEYSADMERGDVFPPGVVWDDGTFNWLSDGFTRYHACKATGQESMRVDVRKGTYWDAVLHAAAANARHGERRTNADKRRQILMVLSNPEWFVKSDSWVAQHVGVCDKTVAAVRRDILADELPLLAPPGSEIRTCPEHARTGKDGKKYPPRKTKFRSQDDDEEADLLGDDDTPREPLPGEEDHSVPPPPPPRDSRGVEVPERLRDVFAARWHFDHALHLAGQLDRAIRSALDSAAGHFLRQMLADGLARGHSCDDVAEVVEALTRCRPHSVVCGQCNNRRADCGHCDGGHWDRSPDDESP